MSSRRRAIGIVRVSQVGKRGKEEGEEDRFASPELQRERIAVICEKQDLELIDVFDEIDVSGGTPLDGRTKGLRPAVEMVESGNAEVVVVAYFDRLVRSLSVQAEVVSRVEAAGGGVLAADIGEITNGTAAKWLSSTMLGMVAEYVRRTTAERTAGAQERAVREGRPPFPLIPGYRRTANGVEPDPSTVDAVVEAFRMRATGATIARIREHLREHGVERSYHGVGSLLRSRLVLGEIHFGDQHEVGVVPAIVDRDTWERVQGTTVARGRKPKSERLLARLGVLRCGSCGGRMVVGTQTQNGRCYPFYRCGHVREDCDQRVTIGAELVERAVIAEVKKLVAAIRGNANSECGVASAALVRDRSQAQLDAAIRAFEGLTSEPAAIERLGQLRAARDADRRSYERVAAAQVATSFVFTVRDWDKLTTLEERQATISAVIEEVTVGPGRGAERITIVARPAGG